MLFNVCEWTAWTRHYTDGLNSDHTQRHHLSWATVNFESALTHAVKGEVLCLLPDGWILAAPKYYSVRLHCVVLFSLSVPGACWSLLGSVVIQLWHVQLKGKSCAFCLRDQYWLPPNTFQLGYAVLFFSVCQFDWAWCMLISSVPFPLPLKPKVQAVQLVVDDWRPG